MQSNITPNFTQFIFKIADGIGKASSPIFMYYIIMLAFVEKYRVDDKKQISIFGMWKDMLPIILIMGIVAILIVTLWYTINLPIGVKTYPTL